MFDDLIFTASSVGPAEGARLSIGGEAGSLKPEDVVTDEPSSGTEQPTAGEAATDEEKGSSGEAMQAGPRPRAVPGMALRTARVKPPFSLLAVYCDRS